MISKHIHCHVKNDNYGRLANYIAGNEKPLEREHAREYHQKPYFGEVGNLADKRLRGLSECDLVHRTLGKGEEGQSKGVLSFDARDNYDTNKGLRRNGNKPGDKCVLKWAAGCWAGNDYELAKQEVADTQALNTRTTKEKTYHLIVSFRPEDQDKLTPENFKEIEKRFAEALGLSEHQRHCGVHVNTDNTHMHIAYNLIHPERLTRVEPWRDYIILEKTCRAIEKEYGLAVDNGRSRDKEQKPGLGAACLEAHSGQKSFESFAHDQGEAILTELDNAKSWEDVHQIFAKRGMELAPRGAGLIVKNRHGKQTAKASSVNRELSLKKLEKRFGKFEKPREKLQDSEIRYGAKPVQKEAERHNLWAEFQEAKKQHKEEKAQIKAKWEEYRLKLQKEVMGRKSRNYLLQLSRKKEAEQKLELEMKNPGNWIEFLQNKARQGDEQALAVLRSRHEEVLPSPEIEQEKLRQRAELLAKQTSIAENVNLSSKLKKQLSSQVLMESIIPDVKMEISSYGHLIYTTPAGEKICDTGKRISFSEGARKEALAYMAAKWNVRRMEKDREGKPIFVLSDGQRIKDQGNNIFERPKPIRNRERKNEIER